MCIAGAALCAAAAFTLEPIEIKSEREANAAGPRLPAGALLAAALALRGIVAADVKAQAAPDRGWVELKYLDYPTDPGPCPSPRAGSRRASPSRRRYCRVLDPRTGQPVAYR